jgi:predicted ester cyclase
LLFLPSFTNCGEEEFSEGETEAFGPPTGKRMEITGITIKRVSEGKIVEAWTNFDALGMMQQLGRIPEAAEQV